MKRFSFANSVLPNSLSNILLCCFIFIAFNTRAQQQSGFSLRAGYIHSIIKETQDKGSLIYIPIDKIKPGFYVGGQYQSKIGKYLLLRNEINFQNKGLITTSNLAGTREKQVLNYNYIGFTPTVGFTPSSRLFLLVGSEFNILLNNQGDKKNTSNIEYGLVARSGYRYKIFSFEIGYFFGINEFRQRPAFNSYKYYNRNIQFGIAYSFE